MPYSQFAYFYDKLQAQVDYESVALCIDSLVKRFDGRKGILLDLACGTGTLAECMAGLGYDVVGVDGSDEMLSAALDKKFDSGLDIQYLCQDMTELDMYGTIDVTVCTLDSLNHLESLEKIKKTFERVSLFAYPDGMFIFDVNTPYKHMEVLGDNTFVYEMEGLYCVWENEYNDDDCSVSITLDFFDEQEDGSYQRYQESFKEIAFYEETTDKALEEAGFEILAKYDDYTDKPVTYCTQRIVYVCKKKNEQEKEEK